MKILAIISALIFSCSAFSDYKYDVNSGNSYYTNKTHNGYSINGFNNRTGSFWNTNIQKKSYGTYRSSGNDKNGNYWTYDNDTGSYHNYGTGKSCYGKGSYRNCY